MGTVTKTIVENSGVNPKGTWVLSFIGANATATGGTVTFTTPTLTAKLTKSSLSRAEILRVSASCCYYSELNSKYETIIPYSFNNEYTLSQRAWTSGATKTATLRTSTPTSTTLSTADLFNSGNPNSRTVAVSMGARVNDTDNYVFVSVQSGNTDSEWSYYSGSIICPETVATITLDVPPTATVSALTTDTPYIYAGVTTASVTVTGATAYYDGAVDSVTLTIGNQTASISGNGTLSILLNAGGTFTPIVTITDSRGQTKDYTLDDITVNVYTAPAVTFDAERTTGTGVLDDEGAYATIPTTLTFTDAIATAVAPTVAVTDEDGNVQTATTTWYSSRAVDGTLSGAVTWSSLSSGDTVYGLISITGGFSTVLSYTIAVTPEDTEDTGTTITDTLQTAFYTVDFLAGGHGIAFGKPALQTGFWCDMDTHLLQGADITGDIAVSGDADITGDIATGGNADVTGNISAGGNVDATGTIISDTNYEDAWSNTGQGYEVTGLSLAGSTYVKVDIDIGVIGVKKPIFNGFDIQGSGTARIHTLGHYIFQSGGHWYASVKMRNDNTSAISNYTVIAYIAWI